MLSTMRSGSTLSFNIDITYTRKRVYCSIPHTEIINLIALFYFVLFSVVLVPTITSTYTKLVFMFDNSLTQFFLISINFTNKISMLGHV